MKKAGVSTTQPADIIFGP